MFLYENAFYTCVWLIFWECLMRKMYVSVSVLVSLSAWRSLTNSSTDGKNLAINWGYTHGC
jgi:hypothetical protein